MKPEEAIKELTDYYLLLNGNINDNPFLKSVGKAIESLEKEIPKRVKYISNGYANCPICETELAGYCCPNFCPNCGQAIYWDDIGYME